MSSKEQKTVDIDQGDVFLVGVPAIPKDANRVPATHRGLVLAEGEQTGHYHAIAEPEGARLFEKDGKLYLEVDGEEATITHEEHGIVSVPKGSWQVGIVRESDPFDDEVRRVRD